MFALAERWAPAQGRGDSLWCGEVMMTGLVATAFQGEFDTDALLAHG